ncbi:MAG: hypothetical protein GY954_05145 [Alteromonas sp.]|nr:hypothetical protein [Alteromonas sp.]
MSHPDYKDIGKPKDRVIEEIGELLQAMGKAERFGLFNHHPDKPSRTNMDDILAEMDDVIEAMERLEAEMRAIRFTHFREQKSS